MDLIISIDISPILGIFALKPWNKIIPMLIKNENINITHFIPDIPFLLCILIIHKYVKRVLNIHNYLHLELAS